MEVHKIRLFYKKTIFLPIIKAEKIQIHGLLFELLFTFFALEIMPVEEIKYMETNPDY
jgi:hypothetical protein